MNLTSLRKLGMVACAAIFALAAHAVEITTTDQLIFPGVTLDELGGLTCRVAGSYLPAGADGVGYFASRNGNTQEVQMQALDGTNVKVAILQLTEKEDGVWVKGTGAKYSNNSARLGSDINVSPTGTFNYGDYKAIDLVRTSGQKLLRHFDYVTTAKTLLWTNRNLSELTAFCAYSDGSTWCPKGDFTVCNIVRGANTATMQFQVQDGDAVKGVEFEFSQDGTDIYGRAVSAYSVNNGTVGACDLTTGKAYSADTYYKPRYIGATVYSIVDVMVDGDAYSFDQSAETTIYRMHGTQDATFTIAENVELSDVVLDFSAYEGHARMVVASQDEAEKLGVREVGTICYTDDLSVSGSPTQVGGCEAVEYAGNITFSGKYESPIDMIFSGNALIDATSKDPHFLGLNGTFVIADGTTTLNGKTFLSHASGEQGANLCQTGGLVTATDNGYFYYGGYAGTIRIDCLGGRWEAPINPHNGNSLPNYDVQIKVGSGAVFAPKNLTFEGGTLTSSYVSNSKIVLEDGATFEVPDKTKIGNWVKIAGTGTILVKSGVTFDCSSCDMSGFGGNVVVEEGGETKGVYTGNDDFYSDRSAIPEERAWLAGTHKYGISKREKEAKGSFKGLTFSGNVTLENKSSGSFIMYTKTDEPLNVTGGVFDGGDVLLAPCHEENSSKTYAINLSNDGVLTNMRLRWGYYWKSQTTMTLNDSSSFTGSLTPMKAKATDWKEDSTFTVNIEDSATFAPTALCAENGTSSDTVSGPCFINLNSVAATFVLPDVVPSWATTTLNAGLLTVRADQNATIFGDISVNDNATVSVPANGVVEFAGTLTGADKLTVIFAGARSKLISPVQLPNVKIADGLKELQLEESQQDGKYIYRVRHNGIVILLD